MSMYRDELDGRDLDRYITGNYGEDRFKDLFEWTCPECKTSNCVAFDDPAICKKCGFDFDEGIAKEDSGDDE